MPAADLVLTIRRPGEGARTHRFSRGPVTVGRNRRCAVRVDDGRVSGVHLRFIQKQDRWLVLDPGSASGSRLNGQRLPANTPRPIRVGDALMVADHIIDVMLDTGGGLTTDSRDTDSVAESLLTRARGGRWGLWALNGASAGASVDVDGRRTVLVGSGHDCDLQLRDDGVAARHASVTLERDGRLAITAHGDVRVRGGRVRRAILWPDDTLHIGPVALRVRGPSGAASAGQDESGGLSLFELMALLIIIGSAGAMFWAWWSG